ncbi:MAG: TM2 domain-containing protein [Bacteroidota bacterium]
MKTTRRLLFIPLLAIAALITIAARSGQSTESQDRQPAVSHSQQEMPTTDATELIATPAESASSEGVSPELNQPKHHHPDLHTGMAPTTAPQKLTFKEKVAAKILKRKIKKHLKKASPGKTTYGDSQVVALVLVLFVGVLGIHRMYLGYIGIGILQLLTAGCCGIWTLIDLIRIITGDLQPKNGPYEETF